MKRIACLWLRGELAAVGQSPSTVTADQPSSILTTDQRSAPLGTEPLSRGRERGADVGQARPLNAPMTDHQSLVKVALPMNSGAELGRVAWGKRPDSRLIGSILPREPRTLAAPVSIVPDYSVPRDGTRGLETRPFNRVTLSELVEYCRRFSPVVGLATADTLLLDATGMGPLFGGEQRWAEQLVAHFQRQGFDVRLAVADTLGAAWAVARFHSAFIIRRSSLLLIPSGETAAAVRLLPIEALRLPERTVGLLHELGIDLVDQLAALPREDLSSRFGPGLLRRWDQAVGRAVESIPSHHPPAEFTAVWDFEPPTQRRETIDAAMEHLVGRLTQQLRTAGRGAIRLNCRLDSQPDGHECAEPFEVNIGLYRPTVDAGHLLGLLQLQLERQRLSASVSTIGISVEQTAPLVQEQPALFADVANPHDREPRHRRHRELEGLIDRLGSRLGPQAVFGIQLLSDAVPERAWRGIPLPAGQPAPALTPALSRKEGGRDGTPSQHHPPPPPLSRKRERGADAGQTRPRYDRIINHRSAIWTSAASRPRLFSYQSLITNHQSPTTIAPCIANKPLSGAGAGIRPRPRVNPICDASIGCVGINNYRRPDATVGLSARAGFDHLPPRPLRLVNEPIALAVAADAPDSPPERFHVAGQFHRLAASRGPERIESGWWRGRAVRRDYYHVETTEGRRLWLFRRYDDRRWFLHGMFG